MLQNQNDLRVIDSFDTGFICSFNNLKYTCKCLLNNSSVPVHPSAEIFKSYTIMVSRQVIKYTTAK